MNQPQISASWRVQLHDQTQAIYHARCAAAATKPAQASTSDAGSQIRTLSSQLRLDATGRLIVLLCTHKVNCLHESALDPALRVDQVKLPLLLTLQLCRVAVASV